MSNVYSVGLALLAVFFAPVAAAGQMMSSNMPMGVGHVHFQNSCSPIVQADVSDGLAALYSFWFDEARTRFERAARRQPECAIAYWGEAMSSYEQIEGSALPEGAQLEAGLKAIAQARAAPRQTAREGAYIDAIAIIYDQQGAPEHDKRVQGFSRAMGAISAAYPSDHQAAVIYAMSLLKDGMPADPDRSRARRSLSILNKVLKREPDNPGVIHFIVHAADNPHMADLGLVAARRYAKLAPDAPHALHMPGHIFARLGLWREDIRSNQASAAAASKPELVHTEAQNLVHAWEFEQYAYLQIGRENEAKRVAGRAARVQRRDYSPGFQRYYAYKAAGFLARQSLETLDWATALDLLPAPDADADGRRVIYWAQAVAAGHLLSRASAVRAEAAFQATYDPSQLPAAEAHPSSMWIETKAWALFAQGDGQAAIALLRPIADRQDSVGKGEVDLPAREMIADMLRLLGDLPASLAEYRVSLRTDPGRFNTLLHAGEVADELSLNAEAENFYRHLLRNARNPDPRARQALKPARDFLSKIAARRISRNAPASRAVLT